MFSALLLGLLASPTLAQFLPEPSGFTTKEGFAGVNVRYKEVPTGICELDPKVKSYAGYADVEKDQHIFFWFFEARDVDPSSAPLSVWINGGPGSSSMIGLWQELGPCGVNYKGEVYSNPYSWTNVSNFLFIDQPTTVGFSYSIPTSAYLDADSGEVHPLPNNSCPAAQEGNCGTFSVPNESLTANTTAGVAPNLWKTLQGFMGAFPKYSRHGFDFTTESYGGHYGPVVNEYFEQQNQVYGNHKIDLKSVSIGNGWYDPLIQYQAYYNFTVSPGNTYDYKPFNASTEKMMYNNLYGPGKCVDQLNKCYRTGDDKICGKADSFCANNVESIVDNEANRDEYDIRELSPDPFPYGFFADYLNTPKVQKVIGAYTNWTISSATTGDAFAATGDDAKESMTIEDIQKLLKQGITVTLYAGDADYNCNWLGGQVVAHEINAPNFNNKAGFTKLVTSDGKTHGVVKQAGNFAFVRFYLSGHEVPFYAGLPSLEMFERAIASKDIATGTSHPGKDYVTKGPTLSTYREGNSTVQFHVLNPNTTYNPETGAPGPVPPSAESSDVMHLQDGIGVPFRTEKPVKPLKRRHLV